jgi:hypothetical protein
MQCQNAMPKCNAKMQCQNSMPKFNDKTQCQNAMPKRKATMQFQNAKCIAKTQCQNAMPKCNAKMQCQNALPKCNAKMQCQNAMPKCIIITVCLSLPVSARLPACLSMGKRVSATEWEEVPLGEFQNLLAVLEEIFFLNFKKLRNGNNYSNKVTFFYILMPAKVAELELLTLGWQGK